MAVGGDAFQDCQMNRWLGKVWNETRFEIVLIGDRGSLGSPFLSNVLGADLDRRSRTCCDKAPRRFVADGVRGIAWLVPALSDAAGYKDEEYFRRDVMESADLVIYCVDMSDTRLRGGVLRTLQELKPDWSRTVIVLTFADALPGLVRHRDSPEFPRGEYFNAKLAEWTEELKAILLRIGMGQEMIAKVKFHPCTNEPGDLLPNGELWLAPLSLAIMEILSPEKKAAFLEEHPMPLHAVTTIAKQPATQSPAVAVVAELPATLPLGEAILVRSSNDSSLQASPVISVLSEDQSQSIRAALSKLRKDCPVFGILVIGRTGVGKSTLINNLLGKEVASVGHTLHSETPEVNPHEVTVDGVPIVVYDSPGLGDVKGEEEEKKHLDIMKALLSRKKIHLVVYCFQMNQATMRSSIVGALRKYHEIGVDWKRSVITLTFADALFVPTSKQALPDFKMSQHFDERLAFWQEELRKELVETIGVKSDVFKQLKIYPTSLLPKDELQNGKPWYVPLWLHIVEILSPAAALRFLEMHRNNIRDREAPPLSKRAKVEVSLVKEERSRLAVTLAVTIEEAGLDSREGFGDLLTAALESGVGTVHNLLKEDTAMT